MTNYAHHMHTRLGGLTRRQVITATPPEVMLEIFQKQAAKYPHIVKFTPERKVEVMLLVSKLGFNGACRESKVHDQTVNDWVNLVCMHGDSTTKDESSTENSKVPFLHLLTGSTHKDRPERTSYTTEQKKEVVLYVLANTAAKASFKYKISESLVRKWVRIATTGIDPETGEPRKDPSIKRQPSVKPAPVQYGLKELSPLAKQVADLEAENADLKARLRFFEQFKQAFKNL